MKRRSITTIALAAGILSMALGAVSTVHAQENKEVYSDDIGLDLEVRASDISPPTSADTVSGSTGRALDHSGSYLDAATLRKMIDDGSAVVSSDGRSFTVRINKAPQRNALMAQAQLNEGKGRPSNDDDFNPSGSQVLIFNPDGTQTRHVKQPDGSYRIIHEVNPQQNAMMQQIGLLTQMFQFVKTYTSLVGNQSEASVAALFTAKEIIGNPKEVAAYFESLLPKTENPVVVRALHMQLADHYKNSGQKDKALEHLTAIITEDGHRVRH